MAIQSADGTGKRLQCLSSDDKPMTRAAGVDVENGTTIHIVDTGEVYVFHDGGWEPDRRLIYALSI